MRTLGIRNTARDVVSDNSNATIWRDSRARVRRLASTCSVAQTRKFGTARLRIQHFARLSGGIDSRFTRPKIVSRAALKRRHVSFSGPVDGALRNARSRRPQHQVTVMTNSAAPHLLPVFARSDLGFERGE